MVCSRWQLICFYGCLGSVSNVSAEYVNLQGEISAIQIYDGHPSLGSMIAVTISGKFLYIPAESKHLLAVLLAARTSGATVVVTYDTNQKLMLGGSATSAERLIFVSY